VNMLINDIVDHDTIILEVTAFAFDRCIVLSDCSIWVIFILLSLSLAYMIILTSNAFQFCCLSLASASELPRLYMYHTRYFLTPI
jgi:hypothetical protein